MEEHQHGRPDEERRLQSREVPPPQGFGSNDDHEPLDTGITLLTPLLTLTTRTRTTAKQPDDDDVAFAAADDDIETHYDQENNKNATKTTDDTNEDHHRTLFQTWRNDLLRARRTFRQILQNSTDHSMFDLVLLIGAQWMIPIIIVTLAFCVPWMEYADDGATITTTTIGIVTATAWHCQVFWIRYAMLVTPLTMEENNHHKSMMMTTSENLNTDCQLQYLSLRRNRRILGCGLATVMVNLPTFLWIMFGDDNNYTPVWAGFGAVVIIFLANSLIFTLVRGGRVEYALPTMCILLGPILGFPLLVAYFLSTISATLKSMEDHYHIQQSSESVVAAELARLHRQSAALSYLGDSLTLSEIRTNAPRRCRSIMVSVVMCYIVIHMVTFVSSILIFAFTPSMF